MYFGLPPAVRKRRAHSTPGTRASAGTCSVSYQALNAASATLENSIAATSMPFAIAVPSASRNPPMLRRDRCAVQPSTRGAGDCGGNKSGGLLGIGPARDVDPFAGFQVFVMAKKMGDLIAQDRRQILIGPRSGVKRMPLIDRADDDLLIGPLLVLHHQRTDGTATHDRSWHHRRRSDNQ